MTDHEWLLAAVPVTGLIAGFMNTLAGNGSLITLPLLILLGLPANVANGTNRVGVLLQNFVAVGTFARRGVLELRGSAWPIGASVAGAVLGAALAVDLDETLLRRGIGVLMILMLATMLVSPERWVATSRTVRRPRAWIEAPIFFGLGVYGGFIQAGIGPFLLAGLVLGAGYNLVAANAMKNLIVLVLTAAALVVFVINDQVNWAYGLLLAAGQSLGAWIAAHLAVERGVKFIRAFVFAVVSVSALALFLGVRL